MELTELVTKFTEMLKIENVQEAPQKLLQVLFSSKNEFFDEWLNSFPDLSVDNLQPIFQYYMADSKEIVQNFTEDTVDNSDESDIIEEDNTDHFIGDNNTEPYKYEYSFEPKVTAEVREAFNEEYQKAVEMYGEIDTVSGVNVLTVVSKDEGYYNDNSQWISLRHAEKKNGLKVMASVAQEEYKAGMWSTGHPRHAMRHEIGHAIQLHHRLYDPEWKEKYSKIVEIFDMATENQNGYAIPSSYVDGDIAEFISECVAASYLNPKKQSKTIKAIFRIITGGV